MQEKLNKLNGLAEDFSKYVIEVQPDENHWGRLQALSRLKEAVTWAADCVIEKERQAKK